jgi:hypothetical protein
VPRNAGLGTGGRHPLISLPYALERINPTPPARTGPPPAAPYSANRVRGSPIIGQKCLQEPGEALRLVRYA